MLGYLSGVLQNFTTVITTILYSFHKCIVVKTLCIGLIPLVSLCRRRAEGVNDTAKSTKRALDVSEKAIEEAKSALKEAHNNLNRTRNATAEVQHVRTVCVCFTATLSLLSEKQVDHLPVELSNVDAAFPF